MVYRCVVCSKFWIKGCSRSFHRFPKTIHEKNIWLLNLCLQEADLQKCRIIRVCSDHFAKEDLWVGLTGQYLKPNAVPIIMSEGVPLLPIDEVKLEDCSSVEECSLSEYRNDDEDSKSFQEEFIEGKRIWTREDFISHESRGLCCDEKPLNEIEFVEFVEYEDCESVDEANMNDYNRCENSLTSGSDLNGGLDCNLDHIQLKGKNHQGNFETRQKSELKPNVDDEYTTHKIVHENCNGVGLELENLKCQLCDYTTTQKLDLAAHKKGVHPKLKKYMCHLCEYTSTEVGNLKSHINSVHLKLTHYKCHMCVFTTTHRGSIRNHIDSVHLKKYKCHTCGYKATFKSSLKYHIECVHLKLKNHKCRLCSYATSVRSYLKAHIEGVHLKVRNDKYYSANILHQTSVDCSTI